MNEKVCTETAAFAAVFFMQEAEEAEAEEMPVDHPAVFSGMIEKKSLFLYTLDDNGIISSAGAHAPKEADDAAEEVNRRTERISV